MMVNDIQGQWHPVDMPPSKDGLFIIASESYPGVWTIHQAYYNRRLNLFADDDGLEATGYSHWTNLPLPPGLEGYKKNDPYCW